MRRWWLFVAASSLGCWFDSRWVQEPASQRAAAAQQTPQALAGPAATEKMAAAKVHRVRVYATAKYVSQTIDWKTNLRDLLDDVSQVLGPAAGARLELSSAETWGEAVDEDLSKALAALETKDVASDVDWVIGLVGGLPKATYSFHDLGIARLFSRHFVLRASTDLNEIENVEIGYDKLKPEERSAMLAARRKHRSAGTMLHELGHTLGAVHEDEKTSLMYPAYDTHMKSYGAGSAALVRAGFAARAKGNGNDEQLAWRAELLALYKKGPAMWNVAEREQVIKQLEASAPPPPPPTPAKPLVTDPKEVMPQLAEKDRGTYEKAHAAWKKNDAVAAWKIGEPLFTAYPKVYGLQDLRCQLANTLGFTIDRLRKECAELMALSTAK